jgi:hypothetical protein
LALELGCTRAAGYAGTVSAGVEWLVSVAQADPARLPPGLDGAFFTSVLDHDAEDRYLPARHG